MKRVMLLLVLCAAALSAAQPRGRPVRGVRAAHSRRHNLQHRRMHTLAGLPGDSEFMIDPSIIASPSVNEEWYPAAAFDGTDYLVVWASDDGVFGTRVTLDGRVLDPGGIQILPVDVQSDPYTVDVSYDGDNYLVVWDGGEDGGIWGVRVTPAGMCLDPDGIAISAGRGALYAP